MADRLYSSARCRAQDTNCKVLALTTSDNGEDWEWADDHLYLDVSQTPVGKPDPPVDASIEQLNADWECSIAELTRPVDATPDARAAAQASIQQLDRINARIKRYAEDNSAPVNDLPPELDLVKGYDHLSDHERQLLKDTLLSEAAFFMKGKYPKVIRTEQPVRIDVGEARPRTAGFRTLNPIQRSKHWSTNMLRSLSLET